MAKRLLEQKKVINQYAVDSGETNFSLTVREWSLLEELVSGAAYIVIFVLVFLSS